MLLMDCSVALELIGGARSEVRGDGSREVICGGMTVISGSGDEIGRAGGGGNIARGGRIGGGGRVGGGGSETSRSFIDAPNDWAVASSTFFFFLSSSEA
jgi:hypothetical protein